jgi:uncharacterized membrane protein YkoI
VEVHVRAITLCVAVLLTPIVASAQGTTSERAAHQDITVREEKAGLLAQAAIRPDSAIRVAKARMPGGRMKEAEIEVEDGKLVYAFDFAIAGRSGIEEVLVDARTGAIVSVEHESAATEQAEERADKAKAAARPAKPAKP